jgi:hypothetical protein
MLCPACASSVQESRLFRLYALVCILGELAAPVALDHVLRRSDPKAAPPPWIGKKESFTPYVNKNKPKKPSGRPPLPPQHELMGGFQIQRPPVHIQMTPFAMPGGMPHLMPGGMPQPGIV